MGSIYKKILAILFVMTCQSGLFANTFHFKGVLDDTTFAHSEFVVVEVLENGQSTTTHYGEAFEMELPQDTLWNICFADTLREKCYEITYVGQDSAFQQTIGSDVQSKMLFDNTAEEVSLEVVDATPIEEDTIRVEEIDSDLPQTIHKRTKLRKTVVRLRKRPRRALGQTTISAKSIKRMPSLAEADVMKSIQALPGVVASSDFSSKLYVRGAGADQNLFLFDNAVVYSPIHLFGLFSTFLVEGIDEVSFYKGGFTPEYGNRLASVVDVKSRGGGNDSANTFFEGSSVKISTFATQAHLEGRYGGFRWLVAGRATYFKEMLDFFRYAGLIDLELSYRFWDRQGSFIYEFRPGQELMFSFYTGEDRLVFETINGKWGNDAYALNYKHRGIVPNLNLYLTVSMNNFYQNFEIEELFRMENGITSDGVKAYKATAEYEGFDDQLITFGVESQKLSTIFDFELLFDMGGDEDTEDTTGNESDTTAQEPEEEDAVMGERYAFWLQSFYLSDAFTLGNVTITPGLRGSFHSKIEKWYYEPRIAVRYTMKDKQTIDLHLGRYKQFINSLQMGDFESLNEQYFPTRKTNFRTLEPSQCDLLSLGYHHPSLLDMFALTVESYYKVFQNLYVNDPNSTPTEIRVSPDKQMGDDFVMGEGYSYGFEFLVRKDAGKVFGGVSYTYGRSVLQDLSDAASQHQKDSAAYYANWDQTHSVKVDLGVNWKGEDGIWKHESKGRYWRSSVAIKYASGLPYPAVAGHMPRYLLDDGIQSNAGASTPQAGRNRARYPWYGRIDIKVFDIGRVNKWSFSYTIINVLGRENVWMYNYDKSVSPPIKDTVTQLPFLPIMLNFEYKF